MAFGILYGVPVVYTGGQIEPPRFVDVRRTLDAIVAAVRTTGQGNDRKPDEVAEIVAELAWMAGLSPLSVARHYHAAHKPLQELEWAHAGGPWGY